MTATDAAARKETDERVVRLGTVGSTNEVAAEAAAAGETGPVWFVAERQTRGRGRRGRRWTSEPGNLYATHLARLSLDPERLGMLPLAAAVALADALADLVPATLRLGLKWPNDVLADGAKVAGILIEARHGPPGQPVAVLAGFGVNCAHAPAESPYPVASLAALGAPVAPATLLERLSTRYAEARAGLAAVDGIARVRERWLERAVGLGGAMTVRFEDRELRGIFAGLDESGRLLLEAADGGREAIAAGDVFPLASPAPGARPAPGTDRQGVTTAC